jgi:exodeoxyribonuclease-3
MKIMSWNVNGIRAAYKKGFVDFLEEYQPDILGLQEIKANKDQLTFDLLSPNGYKSYFNSAERKGYSGTAIYSKEEPIKVEKGFPEQANLNGEGRLLTAEYEDFYFISVYVPNAKRDLSRLDYRQEEWDAGLLKYMKKLEKDKPILIGGDFNVAHEEIDLANPDSNRGNHGFTDEEREGFQNFLDAGFIDTFREKHPEKVKYSWWSYFHNSREKNVGWRIDYILASEELREQIDRAFILNEVMGSDHCPVGVEVMKR